MFKNVELNKGLISQFYSFSSVGFHVRGEKYSNNSTIKSYTNSSLKTKSSRMMQFEKKE